MECSKIELLLEKYFDGATSMAQDGVLRFVLHCQDEHLSGSGGHDLAQKTQAGVQHCFCFRLFLSAELAEGLTPGKYW